jgi:hypothetical protein
MRHVLWCQRSLSSTKLTNGSILVMLWVCFIYSKAIPVMLATRVKFLKQGSIVIVKWINGSSPTRASWLPRSENGKKQDLKFYGEICIEILLGNQGRTWWRRQQLSKTSHDFHWFTMHFYSLSLFVGTNKDNIMICLIILCWKGTEPDY